MKINTKLLIMRKWLFLILICISLGGYNCRGGKKSNQESVSKDTVMVLPPIVEKVFPGAKLEVKDGQEVEFGLQYKASGKIQIIKTKGEKPIESSDNCVIDTIKNEIKITLKNVTEKDNGVYLVGVKNAAGESIVKFRLTVTK